MSRAVRPSIGQFVLCADAPGVARIGSVDGSKLKLEWFESAAQPVADERWVPAGAVRRHQLGVQTRVYWRDAATALWQAGRVIGGGPEEYFIRVPNADSDVRIKESDLRVRWDRPVEDPLQVLLAGAQESPHYRDARLPVLCGQVVQRAVSGSLPAIVSSSVQLHRHQVETAARILADPVQRYLLADEVGLGKTIEAGFVIRQRFIDDPRAKVAVIAPDAIRRQWRDEMVTRFFVDDFPAATFKIGSHESSDTWERYADFDLVVIDEAHQLIGLDPTEQPYPRLQSLCHSVPRLLLLSATPILQRETTHLGLLHLLDSDLYKWEELEAFRRRLAVRRELARLMYALDPAFPFLLPDAINDVRTLLPSDPRFEDLVSGVTAQLDPDGNLLPERDELGLARAVEAVRGHVGETYRLHRRVIRNRRATIIDAELDDEALLPAFEVTGRQRPRVVALESLEHQTGVQGLEDWRTAIRDSILDTGGDLASYTGAFAVLASRTGGPIDDLRAALKYRLTRSDEAAQFAGLALDERRALTAAEVLPGESAICESLAEHAEHDAVAEIARLLAPAGQGRAVLFAGPGSLAGRVARALVDGRFPGAVHQHTAAVGPESAEAAVSAWNSGDGLLVCDQSADDGRNLQRASLVLHLRLPASPNTLEQRVGRVDRYGSGKPARQVIFGDLSASVVAGWRKLLLDGYRIFDRSISALQDVVARDLDSVWIAALSDGIDGLSNAMPAIAQELDDELKSVAQLDMLEASYDATHGLRDLALDIARFEQDVHSARDPFLRLMGGDDGFRMFVRRRQNGGFDIEPSAKPPLLGPSLLNRLRAVPAPARSGFTDRWAAVKSGGRLFRIGNPLVDAVDDVLEIDDRGRASAHWRVDNTWEGDPLAYFGFVYLVEADVSVARQLPGRSRIDEGALRRRADRALAPFVRTVWIPADDEKAVEDEALLRWLDREYRNDDDDVNLSSRRVVPLHALFGGAEGFSRGALSAASAASTELMRVTDLRARCAAAAEALRNEVAVLGAQAAARQDAGRLLEDHESLILDRDLNEALVAGIEGPTIRTLAVTCLVRSRRRWSQVAG